MAISKSTQPRAKTSVRASDGLPSSCSGAMYWRVPRIVPSAVTGAGVVAVLTSEKAGADESGAMVRARPKSSSLSPDFVSITLPGFRSR